MAKGKHDNLKIFALATVPVGCKCGHQHSIGIRGLTHETPITCPTCGHVDRMTEAAVADIDSQFVDVIVGFCQEQGMDAPDEDAIAHLRLHGRFSGRRRTAAQSKAAEPKGLPVGLVGERNFQEAIKACRAHAEVQIWHEPDNPYDGRALAVTAAGKTIGYIPRNSFLQRALLDEKQDCQAKILSVRSGADSPYAGVVIDVELLGRGKQQIATRAFVRA